MRLLRRLTRTVLAYLFGIVTQVETTDPVVALTFDDGPDPQTTPCLLEILARHQAKATFFMVGVNAARYPELVRQVADAGHTIANHSWDHASFPYLSVAQRRVQIRDCAATLRPYGQKLFRPPYGHLTLVSRLAAFLMGYRVVAWNLPAWDWLDLDAKQLFEKVAVKLEAGSIILFHDGLYDTIEAEYADRKPMLEAVDTLLTRFSGEYRFVTVPVLLKQGRVRRQYWQMKADVSFLNQLQSTACVSRRYQKVPVVEKRPTG